MKYDHFHVKFRNSNGTIDEVEGGWTRYPKNYDIFSEDEFLKWRQNIAIKWGMPEDAEILNFWLAG